MENNKAYLKQIHWVLIIAFASTLPLFFLQEWFNSFEDRGNVRIAYFVNGAFIIIAFWSAMGLCTSRWKEAGIAVALELVFTTVDYFLFDGDKNYSAFLYFFLMILNQLPILVFIALISGWKSKLIGVYFFLFSFFPLFTLGRFAAPGIIEGLDNLLKWDEGYQYERWLTIAFRTAAFVFAVILVNEMINYVNKNASVRTQLLNLGNEYDKISSIITFWCLKVMIIVVLAGGGNYLLNYARQLGYRDLDNLGGYQFYLRIYSMLSIICIIMLTFFLSFYLRKFLLESFVAYNGRSKLLYWLCLLPFVGFIAYCILIMDNSKQNVYPEKVETMSQFDGSSAAVITTLIFVLLGIRLIVGITDGYAILGTILAAALFTWYIVDKVGYYIYMTVCILLLLIVIVAIFLGKWEGPALPIVFAAALFGIIHWTLVFPIYHFDKFEYIPAENPEPKPAREFHLFG